MKLYWDDIAESIDIQQVISDLGIRVQGQNNQWLLASCPLPSHPGVDANPSFGINQQALIYNCFVCGSGNIPQLVIQIEGLVDGETDEESAWQQALRWLARYSDIETGFEIDFDFVEKQKSILEEKSKKVKRARKLSLPIFSESILDKMEPAPLEILKKWNISKIDTVKDFRLRYDPNRTRNGYIGPSLIIPHFWNQELVGYQERWLSEDRPNNIPKYTNTNDFPKKETIFNWDRAVLNAREGKPVVVVESCMTTIRLHDIGITSVATFGASVSPFQVSLLGSLPEVILSFDNDVAGKRAAQKLQDKLMDYTLVRLLPCPEGFKSDLADMPDETVRSLLASV